MLWFYSFTFLFLYSETGFGIIENNHVTLDITALLSGGTDKTFVDSDVPLDECLQMPNVRFTAPAHIKGVIENFSGYMRLTAEIDVGYNTECARCLKPLDRTLHLHLDKTVTAKGMLEDEESEEVALDYIIVENNILDLTAIVSDEVLLSFPVRELCSDNCRGLCQKCGKNLNEGQCGCETDEHDPRWEALAALINKEN